MADSEEGNGREKARSSVPLPWPTVRKESRNKKRNENLIEGFNINQSGLDGTISGI